LSKTNSKEEDLILSWSRGMGMDLSASQMSLIGIYLDELCEWNTKIDLAGPADRDGIIRELLLDSLYAARFLPEEGSLLDVGSGAGFPAIPIKICRPGLRVHMMEPSLKKTSFLKHVIRCSNLSRVRVIRGRVEKDGDLLDRRGYDVITARAVAPLLKTLTWCAPHLRPGGLLVNFQGKKFENALREGEPVLERQRISLYKAIPYEVPGKDSERHLLLFNKQ